MEEVQRISSKIKEAIEHVFKVFNCLVELHPERSGEENINLLKKILTALLIQDEVLREYSTSMKKKVAGIRKQYEGKPELINKQFIHTEVMKVVDACIAGSAKFAKGTQTNPVYTKLERLIAANCETDHETQPCVDSHVDVTVTSSQQIILDPFTKQIMKRPVKNIHCGHSYDYESVKTVMKQKRNLK